MLLTCMLALMLFVDQPIICLVLLRYKPIAQPLCNFFHLIQIGCASLYAACRPNLWNIIDGNVYFERHLTT